MTSATAHGDCSSSSPPQLPDTDYLLLLFRALGGSEIPNLLFERGKSPQPRWSDGGFEVHVTPREGGLDQQLVDILSDSSRLNQAMQELDLAVKITTSTNRLKTYSLGSQIQVTQGLPDLEREEWTIRAFKWVCFVFPRDRVWEHQ